MSRVAAQQVAEHFKIRSIEGSDADVLRVQVLDLVRAQEELPACHARADVLARIPKNQHRAPRHVLTGV